MPHKDPEAQKVYSKKYYEENREKVKARKKKYYKENKEEILVRDKKYREDMKTTNPSVVYMIKCKTTNKYYIGQTSTWFNRRVGGHKSRFKRNINDCGIGMQDDYNKYGPDAFEYSILKELDPQASEEERVGEEKNYINEFLKEGKQLYNKLI